jgi:hypothetical protein
MSASLAIVDSESSSNLAKIARFMGLEVEMLESPAGLRSRRFEVVAMHRDALAGALRPHFSAPKLDSIFANAKIAFIHGSSPRSADPVKKRSSETSRSWEIGDTNVEYRFAEDEICRQLRGLSFTTTSTEPDNVFDQAARTNSAKTLITAEGRPFLVITRVGKCEIFFCASESITDIDSNAEPDDLRPDLLPQLVPFLMFLKYSYGDQCWENPNRRGTVIIDDPLLKHRYGFLTHEELLKNLDAHGLAATIAFIPWNYRRTAPRIARLFNERNDRLSICVHGCDHTGAEFGTSDKSALREKASQALRRVNLHEKLTGLVAEPIMVFPQGVFSSGALRALAAEGFLAAVNTSLFAVDPRDQRLTIRDLLDGAVSAHGFPLFGRRYPRSLLAFAIDLFLGKPALIAAHHDDFKNGYSEICSFGERLCSIDPGLTWTPLQNALISAAHFQRTSPATANVRFHTDRFHLTNPYLERVTFRLFRSIGLENPLREILADSSPIPCVLEDGTLHAEVVLEPGAVCDLQIVRNLEPSAPRLSTTGYDARVALRRYFSEFRDNYLARSEALLRLTRSAARIFTH